MRVETEKLKAKASETEITVCFGSLHFTSDLRLEIERGEVKLKKETKRKLIKILGGKIFNEFIITMPKGFVLFAMHGSILQALF